MTEGNIDVTFGPAAADRTQLSKAGLATLDALYRHPIAHNLEWSDVVALFEKLGTVRQKSHNEVAFEIGGEHHVIRKPHTKDLTATEIMDVRHLLTRNGWSPQAMPALGPGAAVSSDPPEAPGDFLVVVEHDEARLYHLDVHATEAADDGLRPHAPYRSVHPVAHQDQSREGAQRAAEDPGFYKRIAEALVPGGRFVVVGHGKGHSCAAHHLVAYLKLHHPRIFQKMAGEISADISGVTVPQLLVLGRRALSS